MDCVPSSLGGTGVCRSRAGPIRLLGRRWAGHRQAGAANVAGGNIRNIALHAAFLAADTGEPVRMFHLLRAARSEYAKLEKSLTEAEIAQWM